MDPDGAYHGRHDRGTKKRRISGPKKKGTNTAKIVRLGDGKRFLSGDWSSDVPRYSPHCRGPLLVRSFCQEKATSLTCIRSALGSGGGGINQISNNSVGEKEPYHPSIIYDPTVHGGNRTVIIVDDGVSDGEGRRD